jgi:hypothetical protein
MLKRAQSRYRFNAANVFEDECSRGCQRSPAFSEFGNNFRLLGDGTCFTHLGGKRRGKEQ